MIKSLTLLTILLFSKSTLALEVKKNNSGYQFKIESVDLPKNILNEKFKSGLKTDLIYSVILQSNKQVINLKKEHVNVQYDLWDEEYTLIKNKKAPVKHKNLLEIYTNLESITVFLSNKEYRGLSSDKVMIKTIFFLNPVGKEKSIKIKKWIAERNVGSRGSGTQLSSAGTGGGGVFSGIVNRVVLGELDKDIYGADKRFEFASPVVDLGSVK